jgi:hypothetical protein
MRPAIVMLLMLVVACGTSSDAPSCPDRLQEGDACAFPGRCWNLNGFSSCMSEWCTCEQGRVACQTFTPHDGEACGDEPITSCYYEGNPDCDTAPTSEGCSCDADGNWLCTCSCYGGATCFIDACSRPAAVINGARCADPDQLCTYPGGTTCRCEEHLDGTANFVCT